MHPVRMYNSGVVLVVVVKKKSTLGSGSLVSAPLSPFTGVQYVFFFFCGLNIADASSRLESLWNCSGW